MVIRFMGRGEGPSRQGRGRDDAAGLDSLRSRAELESAGAGARGNAAAGSFSTVTSEREQRGVQRGQGRTCVEAA